MIVEMLLYPIFALLELIISKFPTGADTSLSGLSSLVSIMAKGFTFFPPNLWASCIASIMFWKTRALTWIIVEWIYKKIPGVE